MSSFLGAVFVHRVLPLAWQITVYRLRLVRMLNIARVSAAAWNRC